MCLHVICLPGVEAALHVDQLQLNLLHCGPPVVQPTTVDHRPCSWSLALSESLFVLVLLCGYSVSWLCCLLWVCAGALMQMLFVAALTFHSTLFLLSPSWNIEHWFVCDLLFFVHWNHDWFHWSLRTSRLWTWTVCCCLVWPNYYKWQFLIKNNKKQAFCMANECPQSTDLTVSSMVYKPATHTVMWEWHWAVWINGRLVFK